MDMAAVEYLSHAELAKMIEKDVRSADAHSAIQDTASVRRSHSSVGERLLPSTNTSSPLGVNSQSMSMTPSSTSANMSCDSAMDSSSPVSSAESDDVMCSNSASPSSSS